MSASASAGTSPAASTSRRLSKPCSILASPYSTLPKEEKRKFWRSIFRLLLLERFTDIATMTIQIILCEALSSGGVAEACSVVKRVDLIIRSRALLAACKVEPKPVLSTYDQLLSYDIVVLCVWVGSVFAHTLRTTAVGTSPILGGLLLLQQTAIIKQGARDKITSLANGIQQSSIGPLKCRPCMLTEGFSLTHLDRNACCRAATWVGVEFEVFRCLLMTKIVVVVAHDSDSAGFSHSCRKSSQKAKGNGVWTLAVHAVPIMHSLAAAADLASHH
ncbi:hypothetical protein ZIOFF_024964 [Zingiber officinale]|uniref:Uncharacterized protein n=1 Tax=Zingiber officinale TaxID=94328 RepID=A0A8J5H127_ZINOF|nr:hypothetical protein ZIOFF_024964 [Zingiber officinale]